MEVVEREKPSGATLELWKALETGDIVAVKAACENGADPLFQDGSGNISLHLLASAKYSTGALEIFEFLLASGASPAVKNANGKTPIHLVRPWCDPKPHDLLLTRLVRENELQQYRIKGYGAAQATMNALLERT